MNRQTLIQALTWTFPMYCNDASKDWPCEACIAGCLMGLPQGFMCGASFCTSNLFICRCGCDVTAMQEHVIPSLIYFFCYGAICWFSVEEVLELQLFYPAFECGPVTLLHGNFQLPKLRQSKLAAGKKGHFGSSH